MERALRILLLSDGATLQARALQVESRYGLHRGLLVLVQDELDRRRSRLLDRRYALSALPESKGSQTSTGVHPDCPARVARTRHPPVIAAARLHSLPHAPARATPPKRLRPSRLPRLQGLYREAHQLIEDINEARELGEMRKLRAQLKAAELLLIDDLFLRKLPASAGDELADVLMSRYEKASTIVTSNRPFEDWAKLLGDVVVVTPLLDRLMHHGHLLKFEGKSWRLKEAAARVAKRGSTD